VFVRERAPAPTARSGAEAPGAPARPGVVVHCAAFTNVDAAEAEPVRAARVNHQGTAHVAEAAARLGMRFVYVSTDYVFDGEARTPYRPDAAPGPRSVYGRTKLAGERAALSSSRSALVVRTSWLYARGGRNFVTAMLERGRTGASARVVEDQRGRPTWARNAACGILDLAARRAKGIWHCADSGEATWLELAREIYRLEGIEAPLFPTSTEEWGAPAPRPPYSVLDLRATEALLGRRMPDWREALRAFLETQGAVGAR